ncbi:hypothetical protein [Actinomadura formosensis]|uniref:hypothetical protein n=1 Tax=Actinomadura formosensis TaxID=60706 RepID=UPI003D8E5DC1
MVDPSWRRARACGASNTCVEVRERIANAIEAELEADGDGSSWDGGMSNAARIARGENW